MPASASSALNYALSFVGTKESPANSNRGPQIDKWEQAVDMIAQPWCGAFVHAALDHAGVKGLSSRMRYCPYIIEDAKAGKNGLLKVVPWEDRTPGDLLVYQWDTGPVDHVGLYFSDARGPVTVNTVEGNTAVGNDSNGGEVMRRVRDRKFVAAVVRPAYPATPADPCEWPGITLQKGSKGALVKHIQGWVNTLQKAGFSYNHLDVDGDFGDATEHAIRVYQDRHDLTVDGVVGPKTWAALCASVRALG